MFPIVASVVSALAPTFTISGFAQSTLGLLRVCFLLFCVYKYFVSFNPTVVLNSERVTGKLCHSTAKIIHCVSRLAETWSTVSLCDATRGRLLLSAV